MKREARVLLGKSIDSVILAVEHFNRPWNQGREEAVLILLDRAFELVLKASILEQGGKIREKRAKQTIGFDACVRKCLSDDSVKCLTNEQAVSIQIINSLRDAAQHYILEISEQQLYLHTQAGLTLFKDLIKRVFSIDIHDHLPNRVLPISTSPPRDLAALITAEFDDIKALVAPGSRQQLHAMARLRALQIMEDSLGGSRSQPGDSELKRLIRAIRAGKNWQDLFPGVASLRLDTKGTGLNVSIRLTKKRGEPVTLVPEGTPGATVVAVKRVDELGFYSMGLLALAEKLELSPTRALALVRELEVQSNPEYFKMFKIGSVTHKRYSMKCLHLMKKKLPEVDMDEIWERHKPTGRRKE
jgi:hypothetical protein